MEEAAGPIAGCLGVVFVVYLVVQGIIWLVKIVLWTLGMLLGGIGMLVWNFTASIDSLVQPLGMGLLPSIGGTSFDSLFHWAIAGLFVGVLVSAGMTLPQLRHQEHQAGVFGGMLAVGFVAWLFYGHGTWALRPDSTQALNEQLSSSSGIAKISGQYSEKYRNGYFNVDLDLTSSPPSDLATRSAALQAEVMNRLGALNIKPGSDRITWRSVIWADRFASETSFPLGRSAEISTVLRDGSLRCLIVPADRTWGATVREAQISDFVMAVSMSVESGSGASGIALEGTDGATYGLLLLSENAMPQIVRFASDGSRSLIREFNGYIASLRKGEVRLKVKCFGGKITCYVNDREAGSVQLDGFQLKKAGLMSRAYKPNFLVTFRDLELAYPGLLNH